MTCPSQLGRQVGGIDVLLQLGLVALPENVNLSDGGLVEPWFDQRPDGGEEVWSLRGKAKFSDLAPMNLAGFKSAYIDDEHVTHGLRLCQEISADSQKGSHPGRSGESSSRLEN